MIQEATSYLTQRSSSQNVYGSSGEYSEQNSWQAYYNHAQQLYSAGDQEQAGRYYAHAQLLYNAELQKEQQEASDDVQARGNSGTQGCYEKGVTQQVGQQYTTQASLPPNWETYYNYAQQLYAAGYQQQAEVCYRQAQQLFIDAENQSKYQTSTAEASNSVAPQHTEGAYISYMPQCTSSASSSYVPSGSHTTEGALNSYAPQYAAGASNSYMPQPTASASNSYAPQQSSYGTTGRAAQTAAASWGSSYVDDEYIKRPKRSLKKRLKIWAVMILVSVPVIGIGGFVSLFSYYKDQLKEPAAEKAYDTSIVGKVKSATIQPVVDALKPVFDKTIRLSEAAQPLLYELNLRDTRPKNLYPESSNTVESPEQPHTIQPAVEAPKETATVEGTASPTVQNEEKEGEASPKSLSPELFEEQDVTPTEAPASNSPSGGIPTEPAFDEKKSGDKQDAAEPDAVGKKDDGPSKEVRRESKSKQKGRSRSSLVRRRSRHSKSSYHSGHDNAQTRQTDTGETQRASSQKRKEKSGLTDDPMGSLVL